MKKLFLFIVVLFLGNAYAQNGQVMHEIAFDSLGVKTMGSTYVIDRDKDASTLIHELTHQLMSSQACLLYTSRCV